MTARSAGYCRACDHRMESPAHQQRCVDLPARVLADVLDLCDVIDRQQPVYRAIPTKTIRELLDKGAAQ